MVVNYNYEGATVAIGQPERHKWDWKEAFWIYFGYWLHKKKKWPLWKWRNAVGGFGLSISNNSGDMYLWMTVDCSITYVAVVLYLNNWTNLCRDLDRYWWHLGSDLYHRSKRAKLFTWKSNTLVGGNKIFHHSYCISLAFGQRKELTDNMKSL